jgi:hypothetical protein
MPAAGEGCQAPPQGLGEHRTSVHSSYLAGFYSLTYLMCGFRGFADTGIELCYCISIPFLYQLSDSLLIGSQDVFSLRLCLPHRAIGEFHREHRHWTCCYFFSQLASHSIASQCFIALLSGATCGAKAVLDYSNHSCNIFKIPASDLLGEKKNRFNGYRSAARSNYRQEARRGRHGRRGGVQTINADRDDADSKAGGPVINNHTAHRS